MRVTEETDKNNLRSTRANFKEILKNYHGAQGFVLLAHSLLMHTISVTRRATHEVMPLYLCPHHADNVQWCERKQPKK